MANAQAPGTNSPCPLADQFDLTPNQVMRSVKPAVSQIAKFQATQLMSLAFGQGEDKAALKHNLTDPKPYLREKGVLS